MNERIKELWFNAKGYYRSGNQHEWPVYVIDNPQQFAELIIKECITSIRALDNDAPYDEWTSGYTSAIISAAEAVEERFGIKE